MKIRVFTTSGEQFESGTLTPAMAVEDGHDYEALVESVVGAFKSFDELTDFNLTQADGSRVFSIPNTSRRYRLRQRLAWRICKCLKLSMT